MLFSDSAFANADTVYSQIGFVLLLTDDSDNCNIVHYGSSRCKRVTRSVMAAELRVLVYGFDTSFVVRHTLAEALGNIVPLDAFVDSRTVFNAIAKTSNTLEKRLQIDASALRESHKNGEMRTFGWISSGMNPSDGLTRDSLLKESHPLRTIMSTNKFRTAPDG